MAALKAGDRVKVTAREVTAEDVKSNLYFAYFGGLVGTVDRVYDDGSTCIDIDLDSLHEEMRQRHKDMEESERKRWLSNLSDEARNRLTAEQKQFRMAYKILVAIKDVEPHKGDKPGKSAPKAEKAESAASESDHKGPARAPEPEASAGATAPSPAPAKEEPAPKRLSEADLAAAEEAMLRAHLPKA